MMFSFWMKSNQASIMNLKLKQAILWRCILWHTKFLSNVKLGVGVGRGL